MKPEVNFQSTDPKKDLAEAALIIYNLRKATEMDEKYPGRKAARRFWEYRADEYLKKHFVGRVQKIIEVKKK